MSYARKYISICAVMLVFALLGTSSFAGQPLAAKNPKDQEKERVAAPVNIAILIQDDLVSHVSNELKITREFIQSLPEGSRVMVGYVTAGSLQVRQPFTNDLAKAAKSLRILTSSSSASPYNPYVEVLEALRKFDSANKNENVLLLVSDGLDTSRGIDAATLLHSIDLDRAIAEAKRRDVTIFSFYAPTVSWTSRNFFLAGYGQGALNRVSHETGGQAFFQGTTDFVTFNPYFERLTRALNRLETRE